MLGLKFSTDIQWLEIANQSIAEVLSDHAYCEQKAASNGISLIQRFPDYELVVNEITPLVAEEWQHFQLVLKQLKLRNLKLGVQRKNHYAVPLQEFAHKGGTRTSQLLERLLFSALIEARSCEKFKLLTHNLDDPELKQFYKVFMVSEARHYKLFIDLAHHYGEPGQVEERWQQWLSHEAQVIQELRLTGKCIHY